MHVLAIVLSLVLSLCLLLSGALKLLGAPRIVRLMADVGVTRPVHLHALGALQVAGAVGLVGGLVLPPIGVAAAVGLVLYFGGAIGAHVRAHDGNVVGTCTFFALSCATLVVLVLAA